MVHDLNDVVAHERTLGTLEKFAESLAGKGAMASNWQQLASGHVGGSTGTIADYRVAG